MANAAVVISNQASGGTVGSSSQVLTMPASNLLTPHPSERWRSTSNADYVVLDKGSAQLSSVAALFGMTGGANTTVRLRLSEMDSTGFSGEVLDTGIIGNGSQWLDVDYGSFVYALPSPLAWRYARFDITDPDAAYVEAGAILDGLRGDFTYNFSGGSVQQVDRSRVSGTSSGLSLTWEDNTFRRAEINLDWVTESQRNGVIRTMDRVCGKHKNMLLILDTAADNLPRESIFGLATDVTAVAYGTFPDLFAKTIRIDERI